MKFISAVSFVLLTGVLAHAIEDEATLGLRVLSAINEAPNFENVKPNQVGVHGDPRFMRNEFKMFLKGALNHTVVGYGEISIAQATCNQNLACTAVLKSEAGDLKYQFRATRAADGTLKTDKVLVDNGAK